MIAMDQESKKRISTVILRFALSLIAAFLLGVLFMYLRLPPVDLMANVKNTLISYILGDEERVGDKELLRFAFTDPLIEDRALLYEPLSKLADIRASLDSLFISTDDFWALSEGVQVLGHSMVELESGPTILQVTFEVDGAVRQAYAYGDLIPSGAAPNGAALIIPGSGHNQALSIATSDPRNYHCCMWGALEGFAKFVQIKPNEDARAIHNGSAKLNSDFYVVDFLERGGSYSATYIAEAAAILTFLKSHYETTSLLGLSQGGKAALITALLSEPDALVVASGYSTISVELVQWAGASNQIIIPGLADKMQFDYLARNLTTPTLFTWGKREVGTYQIESRNGETCKKVKQVEHFTCLIHDRGHIYPETEVLSFLDSTLG